MYFGLTTKHIEACDKLLIISKILFDGYLIKPKTHVAKGVAVPPAPANGKTAHSPTKRAVLSEVEVQLKCHRSPTHQVYGKGLTNIPDNRKNTIPFVIYWGIEQTPCFRISTFALCRKKDLFWTMKALFFEIMINFAFEQSAFLQKAYCQPLKMRMEHFRTTLYERYA